MNRLFKRLVTNWKVKGFTNTGRLFKDMISLTFMEDTIHMGWEQLASCQSLVTKAEKAPTYHLNDRQQRLPPNIKRDTQTNLNNAF